MKNIYFLGLALLFSVFSIDAANHTLSGYVIDKNGIYVSNINISIAGLTTTSVTTDNNGFYSASLASGTYTISIPSTSYLSTSKSVTITDGDKSCLMMLDYQEIINGNVDLGQEGAYPYAGIYEYDNLRIDANSTLYSYGITELVINVKGTLTLGSNVKIRVRNGYSGYSGNPSTYPSSVTKSMALLKNASNSSQYTILPNVFGKGGDGGAGGNGANGMTLYFPVAGGTYMKLSGGGGNGGGGGGGGFGGGSGGSGGFGGFGASTASNGMAGGAGVINGGAGGRGLVVSGGTGGGNENIGGTGTSPGYNSYGGGAGGGGNAGIGGTGASVDNATYTTGQAGYGGNGGGGGGGGYGGGVLVITANEIVCEGTVYFLVNGQEGGTGGPAGYSYYTMAKAGTTGSNGNGGLLIINCPNYNSSMISTSLTTGSNSDATYGHGLVTGSAGNVLYNVSIPDSIHFSNLVGRVVDCKGIIGKGLTVKVGSVSKTTDENGIFEIGGLSSGIDSITVSDDTSVLYSTSITLKPGGNTIDIAVMDITTGIRALTEKGLSLYPNPAINILHISGLNEGASVAILDVSGKTVLHHQQVRDAINISSLEKGIYILKIMTNEGIATERFVKE
jgi:hypothetical protein